MKTHYDVLNLDKNCSGQEIKESFIRLSKKYHPDKNKSSDAHKKFVEVNEAYSVLGKAKSRHLYDESLQNGRQRVVYKTNTTTKNPWENYADMYAQNIRRNQEMSRGYVNITKVKAVCFCFLLMAVGSGLQMMTEARKRRFHSHQIALKIVESRNKMKQELKYREMSQMKHRGKLDSVNTGEQ